MKHRQINYTPQFLKSLKHLPKDQLNHLSEKEKIFLKDPYDPRLKTHKLSGKLRKFYAFSVSYHWRIVFHFVGEDIYFDNIGTHEVYK
ncbi:MAG: type II toxin-antitoxin system mRNA interferase toxin, RelE/StbE family [Candidatus Daviesbacteria bacterium]|nr:type II toxin-antitoxin system mRNA interferase toxin, RelE/StbE family [Candidatus Daviesbacteria bacterium]